ncbi:MAG: thermonuclease family protein [Xanthobacteraceae bacterium]
MASAPVQSARPPAPTASQTFTATFSICGAGRRINCVVDGDTFWFRGEKIRFVDIDAPELSPPRCEREAELGEAATRRLQTLLNAGPFTLATGARDQDRYGRKLRTVLRGGHSVGEMLIAEGLARRWSGPRRSWCDG